MRIQKVMLLLCVGFCFTAILTGCNILPKNEIAPTVTSPTVITRPTIVNVECSGAKYQDLKTTDPKNNIF